MSTDQPVLSAADFAAGLSNRLLHCRELGHTWRPFTVSYDKQARAYDRQLRCSSCHTLRVQVLTEHGHVIRNGYKYVPGYLAENVERNGALRDAYRVEAVQRFLVSHDQNSEAS